MMTKALKLRAIVKHRLQRAQRFPCDQFSVDHYMRRGAGRRWTREGRGRGNGVTKYMHRDIEDMRIRANENGVWMVTRKESRNVFGPKQPDQHPEQILKCHLFHDILLAVVSLSSPSLSVSILHSLVYDLLQLCVLPTEIVGPDTAMPPWESYAEGNEPRGYFQPSPSTLRTKSSLEMKLSRLIS
jgi:hypothetical protein